MAAFVHRITLQPIHTQACEAFEVAINGAQYRARLDGDGGQGSIADEIPAPPGTNQQTGKQRGVTIGGSDNPRARMCEPFVHEAQRVYDG